MPCRETDLFFRITYLAEHWPPRVMLTHAPLPRSCQNIANLLPLSTVFSFHVPSVWVVNIALLQSRLRVTRRWSQRFSWSKSSARSALRKISCSPENWKTYQYRGSDAQRSLALCNPACCIARSQPPGFLHIIKPEITTVDASPEFVKAMCAVEFTL